MKGALMIFVIFAAILVVNCLPTTEDDVHNRVRPSDSSYQWNNQFSYEFIMCRLQCRDSCFSRGYWRGACQNGECHCYGYMGDDYPKMNEPPMLLF
ncbi:hypothetical protein Phum_PHUM365950 [Pediculus humanus corporis]|uniref:Uncharacterized protein n=1 Tax=Pediculus humanus subsp. corporis TaxID=121224 RepID=E0VPU9_PEDHC|nr:uncharacterized protein Phum_PHUM365950 [Pediculus humanus corporis]EEB15405.1 hypothetical protein Phum_PHUM365950 [Pediculus humanus corporis]